MSVPNTHYGATYIQNAMKDCRSIFFIGIGGISMSALARISAKAGYTVGGSDRGSSEITRELSAHGIKVFAGHDADHVTRYDAVVYTVAIDEQNPEYLAAKRLGKHLFSRADYLGYLMMYFDVRLGVSGMHGKSTCTAMCDAIFCQGGDPTVLCGAELSGQEHSSCRIGQSRAHFIFEACEYMDSFLDFNPTLAIVLNIGMDHVDYFHSMEQIRASFRAFAARTGENGILLCNADDAESVRAFSDFEGRTYTFGILCEADFSAQNLTLHADGAEFDFYRKNELLGRIRLQVCGIHSVYNALAAASAAHLCGMPMESIQEGLLSFAGAHRRMEKKGSLNGAVVYDDYAHHPDEIAATIAGAKQMGFSRVICAYQPHTYSRTVGLFDGFVRAFRGADKVFFADIYAAREENPTGITSEALADAIGEHAAYCGGFDCLAKALCQEARAGDLVIVMGAGDIFKVFDLLPFDQKRAK
ncbi:MAG: UDP-N-acetylmuramate--L-alanine ligase [Clostridia bacterium]|nr:UDP-N-acetylmuramate--L-alanine ligase [Clostridia bacterium]